MIKKKQTKKQKKTILQKGDHLCQFGNDQLFIQVNHKQHQRPQNDYSHCFPKTHVHSQRKISHLLDTQHHLTKSDQIPAQNHGTLQCGHHFGRACGTQRWPYCCPFDRQRLQRRRCRRFPIVHCEELPIVQRWDWSCHPWP